MPEELCLCNFCTKFGERERCRGKLRVILVTIVEEIDSPLWLARYEGELIIVKVYGGTPVIGNTYLAWLLCLSGEYVIFLFDLSVFYVLYQSMDLYMIELPGTSTSRPAWDATGDLATDVGLGIGQQEKVLLSAEDKLAYSADEAATWSYVITGATDDFGKPKFDLTTPGMGVSPNGWVGKPINTSPSSQTVSVYSTTDGGATWATTDLGTINKRPFGSSMNVAPFHDGEGFYLSVALTDWSTHIFRHDGDEWIVTSPGGVPLEAIDVDLATDPTNTDILYGADRFGYLFKLTWSTQASADITPVDTNDILTLQDVVVTLQGTVIIPLALSQVGGDSLVVYRSTDGGSTWESTDMTTESGDPNGETCHITIASDGTIAMMLYSGLMAYSQDDGATWQFTSALGIFEEPVDDIGAS